MAQGLPFGLLCFIDFLLLFLGSLTFPIIAFCGFLGVGVKALVFAEILIGAYILEGRFLVLFSLKGFVCYFVVTSMYSGVGP